MKRWMLVLPLLLSCSQGTIVNLKLRIAGDARKSPLRNPGTPNTPASDVDVLRLEAYNPTLGVTRQGEVTNDFAVTNEIKVGALDITEGADWRTQLLGNDRYGALFSLGRSEAFDIPKQGTVDVNMVLGIADDFATTAVVPGGLGPFTTATVLKDGAVLLMGLAGPSLFEPHTGLLCTDCLTGDLPAPRHLHTATSLADGNVLIAGGATAAGQPVEGVSVFTPRTRSFAALALPLWPARYGSAAAVMPGGRVLIAGGRGAIPADGARVVIIDVAAGTLEEQPPLPEGVMLAAAASLQTGEVLITGGLDANGAAVATASVYAAEGGAVRRAVPMLERRAAHSATLLADGYVFLFGGRGALGATLSSSEVFTPGGKFLRVDSANLEPRAGHAAVRLDSDAVLIVGGQAEPAGPPDPARLVPALRFSPEREASGKYAGTFVPVGQVVARNGAAIVALPDLSVLVAGGARPTLAVDPSMAPVAGDWVESLEIFVPCAIRGKPCPR